MYVLQPLRARLVGCLSERRIRRRGALGESKRVRGGHLKHHDLFSLAYLRVPTLSPGSCEEAKPPSQFEGGGALRR